MLLDTLRISLTITHYCNRKNTQIKCLERFRFPTVLKSWIFHSHASCTIPSRLDSSYFNCIFWIQFAKLKHESSNLELHDSCKLFLKCRESKLMFGHLLHPLFSLTKMCHFFSFMSVTSILHLGHCLDKQLN